MTDFVKNTLARVRAEICLNVLAHVLKRVTRILGIGEMMRPMSACATPAHRPLEKRVSAPSHALPTA